MQLLLQQLLLLLLLQILLLLLLLLLILQAWSGAAEKQSSRLLTGATLQWQNRQVFDSPAFLLSRIVSRSAVLCPAAEKCVVSMLVYNLSMLSRRPCKGRMQHKGKDKSIENRDTDSCTYASKGKKTASCMADTDRLAYEHCWT